MRVLNVNTLENGDTEYEIELTDEERKTIKGQKGWKRLTQKRLNEWFLEGIRNTKRLENENKE